MLKIKYFLHTSPYFAPHGKWSEIRSDWRLKSQCLSYNKWSDRPAATGEVCRLAGSSPSYIGGSTVPGAKTSHWLGWFSNIKLRAKLYYNTINLYKIYTVVFERFKQILINVVKNELTLRDDCGATLIVLRSCGCSG